MTDDINMGYRAWLVCTLFCKSAFVKCWWIRQAVYL